MSRSQNPRKYLGVRAVNPPNIIYANRAPTSSDTAYVSGDIWLDKQNSNSYQFNDASNWIPLGGSSTSVVASSVTSPIYTTSSADMNIISSASHDIIVKLGGDSGAYRISFENLSGSEVAHILSNGAITAKSYAVNEIDGLVIEALTILAVGLTADLNINITPQGSGKVNITKGSISLSGAASQLQIKGSAVTDFIGTATLVAGTVTIANTNISASDRIIPIRIDVNGSTAIGNLVYSITPSTSFTISSVQDASPASIQTNDISNICYIIIRQL